MSYWAANTVYHSAQTESSILQCSYRWGVSEVTRPQSARTETKGWSVTSQSSMAPRAFLLITVWSGAGGNAMKWQEMLSLLRFGWKDSKLVMSPLCRFFVGRTNMTISDDVFGIFPWRRYGARRDVLNQLTLTMLEIWFSNDVEGRIWTQHEFMNLKLN